MLSESSDVMLIVLESAIIIICDCSPVSSSLPFCVLGSFPSLTEVQLAKACQDLAGVGISSYVCTLSVVTILSGDTIATLGASG